MIIYTDNSWPLWARVAIAAFAVALLAVLSWRYYKHFWRR